MAAQQNQNFLMQIMIVILGLALGYFYYSGFVVPTVEPVLPPPIAASDDLKSFEGFQIDFSILANNKFKALQIFGESPVNPGTTGKNDLFAPI
ncbi:MAG: hypothetical protein WD989_02625 [Candidatus Paceibacterota bacterium]